MPDVAVAARFFEEFFGFQCVERQGQNTLAILLDETGFSLILSNFDRLATPEYPRDFHVGFIQENKEQVTVLYQRLHAAGHASQSPRRMYGNWAFCFAAPGNIQVEVSCPLDRKA